MKKIRIGTRGSALALWQAEHVRDVLKEQHPGMDVELVIIKTTGDKILDKPLADIGKSLFTKEIEQALIDNEVDLAVHSLKDLPTQLPEGLELGVVPKRGPHRDVFVSKRGITFDEVPSGATIATGSLRRRSQLLFHRPDLKTVDLRGNVQTRLKKLEENDWEGIILAEAGLVRLGLEEKISQILPLTMMLPAVGQGALGIEIRSNDTEVKEIISTMKDEETTASVLAERNFLRRLEGGCQVPIGAKGEVIGDKLNFQGLIADLEGKRLYKGSLEGSPKDAEAIGKELAEFLLKKGGQAILDEIREKMR